MIPKELKHVVWMAACAVPFLIANTGAAATCPAAPEPVYKLEYGSRYADNGEGSTTLDEDKNAEVDEALEPVDDFLRDLTTMANKVYEAGAARADVADCVMWQIASWADAGALANLKSRNAKMTIGSRLGSLGMIILQVAPYRSSDRDLDRIRPWLADLMQRQMLFWEETATDGAKRGNLRAWAALGGATAGAILEDPVITGWAAWSTTYVMCTANADGSLPQEMSRGKFALHYQLHAIAPMAVSSAILFRQGIDISTRCNNALVRIVDFAFDDLDDGAATQAITGEVQSYFDGTDTLESFNLAWIEAYLSVHRDEDLDRFADQYRPLSYSKLGGNQTLMWRP